jgi:hypothetical protein
MTPNKSRNLVRRYLLGDLTGSDQEHCEEKFMTGDTSLAELEVAEDELLDEYLAGRLTADEREQFERHFLSTPERQKKLRFAKVFRRYVAAHQPAPAVTASRIPPSLFNLQTWPARIAIVATLLVMAGFWLYMRSGSVMPSYATVTLSISTSTRSAGANDTTVALPDSAGSLRVILLLPEDAIAQNYRVDLESDNGETIPTSVIEQKPDSLIIEIPNQKLQRRQYVVRLFKVSNQGGEQRIPGNYFFSVK